MSVNPNPQSGGVNRPQFNPSPSQFSDVPNNNIKNYVAQNGISGFVNNLQDLVGYAANLKTALSSDNQNNISNYATDIVITIGNIVESGFVQSYVDQGGPHLPSSCQCMMGYLICMTTPSNPANADIGIFNKSYLGHTMNPLQTAAGYRKNCKPQTANLSRAWQDMINRGSLSSSDLQKLNEFANCIGGAASKVLTQWPPEFGQNSPPSSNYNTAMMNGADGSWDGAIWTIKYQLIPDLQQGDAVFIPALSYVISNELKQAVSNINFLRPTSSEDKAAMSSAADALTNLADELDTQGKFENNQNYGSLLSMLSPPSGEYLNAIDAFGALEHAFHYNGN